MTLRPCLEPGCHALTSAGRCPAHPTSARRRHNATARTTRGYDSAWRKQAAERVAAHIAEHGQICPGWSVSPHASADLVCDHDVGPLCRGCNSRKAATDDKQRAAQR